MQTTSKTGRKVHLPTPAEDARINAGIAVDPDSPELTAADFAAAKPAAEFFDAATLGKLEVIKRPRGRPAGSVAENTKAALTMRVDKDVLEAMRESGAGWQTRVNALLRHEFLRGGRRQVS